MEEKKVIQLSELTDSMYMYIKNGVKNKRLENFEKVYEGIISNFEKYIKTVSEEEKETIEGILYLSYITALGDIFEKVKKAKCLDTEYEYITKNGDHVIGIILYLVDNPGISLVKMKENLGLSEKVIKESLDKSKQYFHISEKNGDKFITLSRKGKSFSEYVLGL